METATRRPYSRPVQTAEYVELHFGSVAGIGFLLTTGTRPKVKCYEVRPADSDFGRAFTVLSCADGKTYDVLLDGHGSSCTCPGFCWTGGCKHLSSLLKLVGEGRL